MHVKTVLLALCCWLPYCAMAQTTPNDTRLVPVLYEHYSADELNEMQATDSAKYNATVYYFTRSFIVEAVACDDCAQADLAVFDVSRYEQFRRRDTRYVRTYDKYGFKLTLLSVDELEYKLPIHHAKFQ